MVYAIIIGALTAYLLGNLNGSVCISALVAGDDVRKHGSGNAGLTNFFRSYGGASTFLVMLVDIAKTALACLSCGLIMESFGYGYEGMMLGAVAVSLGHDFPALLGFKGGKGILCGFTAALVLDWRIALAILAVFVIAFAITRYVSLGSVLGATVYAVGFGLLHYDNLFVMIGGIFLGLLAIWMHRSNIARLCKGTESKVHLIHRELNK
ncbi:MAG: glycerol-3-phosphate acyltransferase [Oscillospiraceae bacterium]|nr:glycerol-3-phosphate acyltransferase [Oscillospiraceae bacterium]